jgi:hypothetical protein
MPIEAAGKCMRLPAKVVMPALQALTTTPIALQSAA